MADIFSNFAEGFGLGKSVKTTRRKRKREDEDRDYQQKLRDRADKEFAKKELWENEMKAVAKAGVLLDAGKSEEAYKILQSTYEDYPDGMALGQITNRADQETGQTYQTFDITDGTGTVLESQNFGPESVAELYKRAVAGLNPQTYLTNRAKLEQENLTFNNASYGNREALTDDEGNLSGFRVTARDARGRNAVTDYSLDEARKKFGLGAGLGSAARGIEDRSQQGRVREAQITASGDSSAASQARTSLLTKQTGQVGLPTPQTDAAGRKADLANTAAEEKMEGERMDRLQNELMADAGIGRGKDSFSGVETYNYRDGKPVPNEVLAKLKGRTQAILTRAYELSEETPGIRWSKAISDTKSELVGKEARRKAKKLAPTRLVSSHKSPKAKPAPKRERSGFGLGPRKVDPKEREPVRAGSLIKRGIKRLKEKGRIF